MSTDDAAIQPAAPGLVKDLMSQLTRFPQDLSIANSIVEAALNGGLVDDKKYFSFRILSWQNKLTRITGSWSVVTQQLILRLVLNQYVLTE